MRQVTGIWIIIVGVLVAAWSAFLLYTALTVALHPVLQGSISLSFGLAVVFLMYPISKKMMKEAGGPLRVLLFGSESSPSVFDIVLIAISVFPCIYLMFSWEHIVRHPGMYETYQLIIGAMLVVCLLEGTRRCLGIVIPLLVFGFLCYALVGGGIPGMFGHAGFGFEEILYQLFMMTEGIWGLLTDLTSRLIALFVLFGPVLFATGVGKTFMDISQLTGGRVRGGAGHVAVISSSFFGMLSGSSVANAATTGSFTIPTMKRLGFPPALAGAVEAAASSGGQIMPPIMGAGCFIMAEFLNISYVSVMVAGILPALIYFYGIAAGIWVEAGRFNLSRLPAELMPKMREVLGPKQVLTFILPVGTLVVLLVMFLPPQFCAAWALVIAMAVFLIIGGKWTLKALWERVKIIWEGYFRAVTTALAWLMVMMSCVQVAVTMISLTGFGVKVSSLIIALAGTSIVLALAATMLTALILGMGMTTTAAYVIAAAVLIPAMEGLGLPLLASHLFIFYFAIKSGLTPPVCITVYTASAIAGSNWLQTAWNSMRLGIGGYIIPFYFLFMGGYLMQGSAWWIIYLIVSGLVAMFAIEAGAMGYLTKPATVLERIVYLIAGFMILGPFKYSIIGFALFALGYALERLNPPIPGIGRRPSMVPQEG
ncbi:MAG: TRAP transporter fused permease subunit [Deltaproteobacteria bacterium]|nr:MAG: TRAP transporter fused permease subunit [Deltaproteobacteria bacterium]